MELTHEDCHKLNCRAADSVELCSKLPDHESPCMSPEKIAELVKAKEGKESDNES